VLACLAGMAQHFYNKISTNSLLKGRDGIVTSLAFFEATQARCPMTTIPKYITASCTLLSPVRKAWPTPSGNSVRGKGLAPRKNKSESDTERNTLSMIATFAALLLEPCQQRKLPRPPGLFVLLNRKKLVWRLHEY